MSANKTATPKERLLIGLLFAGMGIFILLMAAGVIQPSKANAPMWVGGLAGIVFLFAGLAVALGSMKGASEYDGELPKDAPFLLRLLQYLLGLGTVAALAGVGSWVAFGPGERRFTATIGFWSGPGNELVGRVLFGTGAIFVWAMLIFFAVRGARKLFGNQAAKP
jgi:hypothetical protein